MKFPPNPPCPLRAIPKGAPVEAQPGLKMNKQEIVNLLPSPSKVVTMDTPTAMTRERLQEALENMGENVLLMDNFDEACIGFSQRINEPLLAVYSWELMMKVCVERDGMTYEEADEYISYNCIGAWVGEQTPIIVMPIEPL